MLNKNKYISLDTKRAGAPKPHGTLGLTRDAASEAMFQPVFLQARNSPITFRTDMQTDSMKDVPAPLRVAGATSYSADRATICGGCEHNKSNWCEVCGCWLSLKTRLPGATCPMGKW